MTPQELFDTVVGNLRKQGGKALLTEEQLQDLALHKGTCAYRSKDGKKCAAGGLLTDEEYKPSMEGKSILFVMEQVPRFGKLIGYHGTSLYYLLCSLQKIHDKVVVEAWEQTFQELATIEGLIYTPPSAS